MGEIINLQNGKAMETIDHIEPIIVTRTHWLDPEHGFILEAKAKINGKDQFFFLKEDKDEFAFRVCGNSYLDYFANGNELPEYKDSVEIFEEYLAETDIAEEYKPIYFMLHTLGACVAGGVQVPVIEDNAEMIETNEPDINSKDLPF